MRKSNTFDTLFNQLIKVFQLMEGKELTPFQSQLYKNTLNSALEARLIKENPFIKQENPCKKPMKVGIIDKITLPDEHMGPLPSSETNDSKNSCLFNNDYAKACGK